MDFDPYYYPYPSQRMVTYAQKGMVCTSQYLASECGLEILKKGGNAVDAAVATAVALTVLEPISNSIGSDLFALFWHGGKLHGLNASGPAPMEISREKLLKQGHKEMPEMGWPPVTVPGAPAAWAELVENFGRLSLSEVMAPAITYAEEGFPVSPVVAQGWQNYTSRNKNILTGEEFLGWRETFAPGGSPPKAGETWSFPDHARTLEAIAESGAESFYRGHLAEAIDAFARKCGGYIRKEDLAEYEPRWVEPLITGYRGYDIWELPPNGQGLVALIALGILSEMELHGREDIESCHRTIEALKLAFADGKEYIADPDAMCVGAGSLLQKEYLQGRREQISKKALEPKAGSPQAGETVYLAAADGEGNMVSLIQSHYQVFGSGLVVPKTGINLQNRGRCFTLDSEHSNVLAPGKLPYHTIIPGFVTRDGCPIGPFGVMGGFMQPQGHLQVITNVLDYDFNPQAALDAPRWMWTGGKRIRVEPGFPNHLAQALDRRGHAIEPALAPGFGRGQIIWRSEDGVFCGGTDLRADSGIAAW